MKESQRGDRSYAKKQDYAPKDKYMAFGQALRRYREGSSYPSQARLAAALDVSWHAVGAWERAIWQPGPEKVFEIERLLDLPAGCLSRHLGYLPLNAQPSTPAAIDVDPKLDEAAKRMLDTGVNLRDAILREAFMRSADLADLLGGLLLVLGGWLHSAKLGYGQQRLPDRGG